MKKDLHPEYFPQASVECRCGNKFNVGSTKPSIKVDICFMCNPFYTGTQKLVDTAGRVDRFRARLVKGESLRRQNLKDKKNEGATDERPKGKNRTSA